MELTLVSGKAGAAASAAGPSGKATLRERVMLADPDHASERAARAAGRMVSADAGAWQPDQAPRSGRPAYLPPSHPLPSAIRSPGRPLPASARAVFEARLGHDFSQVRIHADAAAGGAAEALGARAFAYGEHVFMKPRHYQPDRPQGGELMAHELTHVLQQRGNGPVIQCDLEDPERYRQVHGTLFSGASGGLLPWEEPAPGVEGTAALLIRQVRARVRRLIVEEGLELPAESQIPTRTTEAALDQDALVANQRVKNEFPQISTAATDQQITQAVGVMTPALTTSETYQREYISNQLSDPDWSDRSRYDIQEDDPRYVAMLNRLRTDTTEIDGQEVGAFLCRKAQLVSGFQRGEGATREIFVHRGAEPGQRRMATLVHELTHFYSHSVYREWVAKTDDERLYNEGFTEYLSRFAMTDEMRAQRSSYANRVTVIETRVAQYVPQDDIARAYFAGEVWRIETRSQVARREFAGESGIPEAGTAREESEASRVGPGINQTVVAGQHYRFLNLGNDRPDPKPEHLVFFRQVKHDVLDPAAQRRIRFVGHASSPGSLQHNLLLSRQRSAAFYRMARGEGLAGSRLIDEANPPHQGEANPTAAEEDPQTRAFNRRVEMRVQAPAGTAAPAGGEAAETEE